MSFNPSRNSPGTDVFQWFMLFFLLARTPTWGCALVKKKMVMFVTWPSSRTEFLVYKVFCNDIYSSSYSGTWRRIKREVNLSRRLPNTSTFVPNDCSQCPFCVLPITRCAFGAHLDVGLAERPTPCRFIGEVHVSFPCFREDGHLLIRRNSPSGIRPPCKTLRILIRHGDW